MQKGDKALYLSEVYYFQGYSEDGRVLLSQSIDGKPTLSVPFKDVRLLMQKGK